MSYFPESGVGSNCLISRGPGLETPGALKETKQHFLCWWDRRSTTTHSPSSHLLSSSLSPPISLSPLSLSSLLFSPPPQTIFFGIVQLKPT